MLADVHVVGRPFADPRQQFDILRVGVASQVRPVPSHLMVEKPAEFNRTLLTYLETLPRPR
jgi:hypothetical protein